MSLVNISLDTATRQVVLAIDGQLVPCHGIWLDTNMENLNFEYRIEQPDENGLVKTVRFSLPPPEIESIGQLNEHGLISSVVSDDKKAIDDIGKFFDKD